MTDFILPSNLLTIAIPTYNRELILDESLGDLLPKIKNFNLEILICDNASTDNTKLIVEKYRREYPHITYYRQPVNIIDKNFVTCLQLSTSKYTWLLSDSSRIISDQLPRVLELLLNGDLVAMVMNSDSRVKDVPSKIFDCPIRLIEDVGWHMGLVSSFIVSKAMTTDEMARHYMETTFIHFGLFFEYLCLNRGSRVYWLSENTTYPTTLNKSSTSWVSRAFDVYGRGWMTFVLSLPSQIPISSKLKCIKDHSLKQGFFEIENILWLKSCGWLKYQEIKPYKIYMPFLTDTSPNLILLVSWLPYSVSRRFYRHYKSVRKLLIKTHILSQFSIEN